MANLRLFAKARRRGARRGSIVILALLLIVVSLGAAAMCIDVSYMQLVQTQLRSATDAATRAGAQGLAQGATVAEAKQMAKDAALANEVAGAGLILGDSDIVFGIAAPNAADPTGRFIFTPSASGVNAIRIQGRRTAGSASGAVPLFLGQSVFGSGPFEASKYATATVADRDIVVVVDRSGSMNGEDAGTLPASLAAEYGSDPTYDDNGNGVLRRIEALKVAVREFRKVIDDLPSAEQLGLVSYHTDARIETNLSHDYATFDSKIYNMDLGSRTNIGDGIDKASAMLQNTSLTRPGAVPVIIVMTDGHHNGSRDPKDAARDAMAVLPRLTIHSVTFSNGADKKRMQAVAEIGQGIHAHAADTSQLVDTFELMARSAGAILIE